MRQQTTQSLIWGTVLLSLAVLALWPAIGGDARLVRLSWNTLRLVGSVCLLAVPLGSVLAFLCGRTDLPGRRGMLLILTLSLFIPLYLQAAAWQAGFGWDGWFTQLSGNRYRPPILTDPAARADTPLYTGVLLEGWRGTIWVHAMCALPWVVLITGLGLRQVEGEFEEQALLDTTPAGVFWHVTLPRALPAIMVAALWVAIVAAGEITVTDLFQVRTYAEEVYTDFTLGTPPGETAVHALPGLAAASLAMGTGCLIATRLAPRRAIVSSRPRIEFPLGRWRWPLAILAGAVVLAVVGVPLASLIYKAGGTATLIDGIRFRGWSIAKLLRLIAEAPSRFGRELSWSAVLASVTATSAVALGSLLAWPARRGGWPALPALLLCGIGAALPGPLIGLGLIKLLNQPEASWLTALYDRTILAPWLALLVRALPWATLILWYAFRSIPEYALEASELEGAGPWTRFWRIALPQRKTAVALAWVVAALISFADLSATILVLPPGIMTVANHIFERLHYGAEDQVAGLCLLLIGGLAALGLFVCWLAGRAGRSST